MPWLLVLIKNTMKRGHCQKFVLTLYKINPYYIKVSEDFVIPTQQKCRRFVGKVIRFSLSNLFFFLIRVFSIPFYYRDFSSEGKFLGLLYKYKQITGYYFRHYSMYY